MATPTPNPLYFACFPLQEYFVNKDTGFPLAGGYVQFFSDPAFTVPKDVYKQSLVNNTWDYTNLGSTLILSSVGTFMDDTGDDIIPFLYPYDAQGNVELYFIRVWSGDPSVQGSVLQFTRQGWPPNLTQGSSPTDAFESSPNLFTNPQFATVNFINDIGQTYYEINVTSGGSVELAPGWSLSYAGSGSLKLSQKELTNANSDEVTNPSYALQIESDAGVAPIKLTQRLSYSPRVFENNYLSVAVLAKCSNNQSVPVTIDYITSTGNSVRVLSNQTLDTSKFSLLSGVANAPVFIDVTNTDPPETGYVDMVMTVQSGVTMQFTSLFGCTVQNASSLVSNVQETNAQQTNAEFWYYKPQLEYKPIPSYTLGWNWPINPCQELGTTVAAVSNAPGLSRYVADETIIFQNVDSSIACSFGNAGMGITPAADTSFAIIKYFSGAEVANILSTPLCVQLKAGGATANPTDLIANVNIYYTFDASLPDLKTSNYYSLVTAVDNTTGVATVGSGGVHGTWYKVPRDTLGNATANLKTANVPVYDFNGWAYNDATPATSVKYCAIVISVSKLTAGVGCTFEYCTLQNGYIPTRPQAASFGENLLGLQQYYEKSYDVSDLPGATTTNGSCIQWLCGQMIYAVTLPGSHYIQYTRLQNSNYSIRFITTKRTNNSVISIYSTSNGQSNNVYALGYNSAVGNVLASNLTVVDNAPAVGLWSISGKGNSGVNFLLKNPTSTLYSYDQDSTITGPIQPSIINGYLNYHYVADARLGIA